MVKDNNYSTGFSEILFALYKLKDDEKYATLSELPFILDSKNLLNLLEYYGGKTITFPTKEDLLVVTAAIALIHSNYNGTNYDECNIGKELNKDKVLECYHKLKFVLS